MATKAKTGDIRPVYQQVGWEVCKKEADKPEKEEWVATQDQAQAELLSHAFKTEKSEK